MIAVVCEITKTGKEIESVIKIVDVKREPHVMHEKRQVLIFKYFSFFYA